MAILPIPCYNSGVLSFFKIITRRSDIFCIFYLQVYMYLFVHMISTFVYLCDCGKFPLPSPSVAFVRKHGDWQSAFSMIYTFAQVESSVWISFNKLLNSRLAKKYFDTRRHFDETQENWLRQNCSTGQPADVIFVKMFTLADFGQLYFTRKA